MLRNLIKNTKNKFLATAIVVVGVSLAFGQTAQAHVGPHAHHDQGVVQTAEHFMTSAAHTGLLLGALLLVGGLVGAIGLFFTRNAPARQKNK